MLKENTLPVMPYLKSWKKLLAGRVGQARASELANSMLARYNELLELIPPADTASQRSRLKNLVLPGLTLYQTLKTAPEIQAEVHAETERLFKAVLFKWERKFTALLNRFPDPFPLVKFILKGIERSTHAEADQVITADTPTCFAFNGRKCFILDSLKPFKASELTVLFCRTDDWIAAAMPRVRWLRTKTLAQGNDVCNFRWEKIETKG